MTAALANTFAPSRLGERHLLQNSLPASKWPRVLQHPETKRTWISSQREIHPLHNRSILQHENQFHARRQILVNLGALAVKQKQNRAKLFQPTAKLPSEMEKRPSFARPADLRAKLRKLQLTERQRLTDSLSPNVKSKTQETPSARHQMLDQ